MASCAVCREDIRSETECPRCGSDNSNLPDVTLGYFASIWAILSFLLIFVPLFILLPGVFSWVDKVLQPIASLRVSAPIALLLSLVFSFYMFSVRDALHHYTLTLGVKEKPGWPLYLWALILFIVGVLAVFFLGFAIIFKDLIVGTEGYDQTQVQGLLVYGSTAHIAFMLVMTGCLALVFACFALAAGLMAVFDYGTYVDERYPAPIYLNERLLLDVVLSGVRNRLGGDAKFQITEMRRLPDAGLLMVFFCERELTTRDGVGLSQRRKWSVKADLWGRLRELVELRPR